ncbi:thioesterase family protein [Motiliproteus sp. SC1-56]|uniref:acyl-CoA thioesterase n=1 Tax=Motiliproteus sp. SC1-56 TaxID=2799565 RepID=UPI001A904CAC|nr:thioesterase family protein [Motiliproteus sp. SC1-56]
MSDILSLACDGDHEVFITRHLVRFGDVDPAGIAYFPRIHNFIHESFENLWEEYIGVRYYHLIQNERVAFPMAHSDVDFTHPLQFGDRPLVKVSCLKIGRASLKLRYVFEVDGKVCVDARTTTVCIDADSFKSIEIPAEYRRYFERIQAPEATV